MPELPEVEVLRRSLEPRLVGERIARIEVRSTKLRQPVRRAILERRLAGQRVDALRRRSKYLLIDCEGGSTLVIHLGMSGRLTLVAGAEPAEPHEHVAFHLASGRRLRFRDPRRFGLVFAGATAGLETGKHFAKLGIEPFDPGFDGAHLRDQAEGCRGPVKNFLMDASVVVGVGNIYASEALFRAGIHPRRSVARLSASRWDALAAAVRAVLSQAIAEGGTTLNDFADGNGNEGYFQVSLSAYGREGEACPRCGTAIARLVLGGRSSYYCPGCQR